MIAELAARGYRAVDADQDGYSHLVTVTDDEPTGLDPGMDWVWREERMERLLAEDEGGTLFVGGCAPNQGRFHARFDHIILLSAPAGVIARRLATRTNNPYGSRPEDIERSLEMKATIEPLLRTAADVETDTRMRLDEVVSVILRHVGEPSGD